MLSSPMHPRSLFQTSPDSSVPSGVEGRPLLPNSLNSLALLFFHTLLRSGFLQLLSFQLLPNSFAKTTGGGYTPKNLPLVFNHFRTLQNSAFPKLARRSSLARSCTRQAAEAGRPVVVPLEPRWSSVVFPRKTLSISFPFMPLPDFFLHNEGGYTPHPSHED
jgi:hypothetical protein